MSRHDLDPIELTLVRTERVVRICLIYDETSAGGHKDNALIHIGISQAMPLLREYYGRKHYFVEGQSVERTGGLVKVILDLSPG
jgi:hypothetical protein